MASPFHFFRKHQKVFMAAAVVLCMVIFVFASALDPSGGRPAGQRADSAEIATWNGGSISEGELRNLVYHRRLVNEFLQRLWAEGQRALGYEQMPRVPAFIFDPRSMSLEDLELQVINTEVAASLAEDAGMTVSDAVINNYLREWGLRQLNGAEIVGVMSSVGRGDTAENENIIFETLRKLLLAHYYDSANFDASATVTPLQRWNDWLSLNQRVSVQAAILPVEDFIDEVPEPTEAQLLELYDEFKDQPPQSFVSVELRQLPAPEPGFAEPQRVRLQYLKGSVADWAERFRDTVTEAEIAAYYEANKRQQFVEMDLPDDEIDVDFDELDQLRQKRENDQQESGDANPAANDSSDADAAESNSTNEGAGDDTASAEEAGDSATSEASSDPDEEAMAETADDDAASENDDTASENSEASEAPSQETPNSPETESEAEQSAADTQQPESTPENDAEPPSRSDSNDDSTEQPAPSDDPQGEQSSNGPLASPFRWVNFQAETGDDEATQENAAENDASTDQALGPDLTEVPTEPSNQEPSSGNDDAESEAEASANSSSGPESGANAPAGDDATQPAETDAAEQQPTERYTPLEDVRETIRDRLAEDKAFQLLPQRMNEALIDLQSAYTAYANAVIDSEEKEQEPPAPPAALTDLEPYAERHELIVENTGLFTYRQLLTESLVGPARNAQTSEETVAQAVFSDELNLYEPYLARDLSGDWYLVQKTEVAPFRVPEFKQVRAEVVEAWKRREAAKLAEARARELAKQLSDGDQSFDAFFQGKDYQVVPQTELFSRKTLGLVGGGANQWPIISTVTGLNNVGPELLDAVFQLQDDEAVGGLNFDHTEAYVVQVRSREMTDEELRELFLITSRSWQGRDQTTQLHRVQFDQARMQELQERVDLNVDPWRESREQRLREQG